ncbi:sensor histidine kinase [Lysinibacillus sp. RS5]|uniref:sensor histidine kinase n=1 Tax=unclassified Lysinibacillus TaxID=2636778 RepID=UPI0035BE2E88
MLDVWNISLIYLPIQYVLLIGSFHYLANIRPKCKIFVSSLLLVFIPSVILYKITFWTGIIYLLLGLTLFFSFYKQKKAWLLYWGIVIIVAIISDHLATTIIFSLSFKEISFQLFSRTLMFISIHILFIYIISLLMKRLESILSVKVRWIITISILCTIGVCYFNIFRVFKDATIETLRLNTIFLTIYFILLLILTGVIIRIHLSKYELKMKDKEHENFKIYVQSLEKVNKDMQKFRHDYLNVLLGMKGYLAANDWKGLETYFNQGILKFEFKTLENNKILGNLKNIQDPALKGLLFNKASCAIEHNLQISIEVQNPLKMTANQIDLTRILGILIDNAIENCLEDQPKIIQIAIIKQTNSTIFVIRNKIKEKFIDINKIFNEGYSTKEKGQGLGLSTVKKIVDTSPDMLLNTWVDDNWFNMELFVKGEKL